jgi:hypothetical protein
MGLEARELRLIRSQIQSQSRRQATWEIVLIYLRWGKLENPWAVVPYLHRAITNDLKAMPWMR